LVAFTRGQGTWYRKGYRGSANDDIYLANRDGTNVRRLTEFNGQDAYPMWSADGKKLFWSSEAFGVPANIVCQEMTADGKANGPAKALTQHKTDGVRKARISTNGAMIVYENGGDLYTLNTANNESKKLAIEAYADDKANTERTVTYNRDATEFAMSPDEKFVIIVVHGELFLTNVGTGKTTRLTDSPADDTSPAWSPDGKKVVFLSDRSGRVDLYSLEADDPEHPEFVQALQFKTTPLTQTPDPEVGISFSPDGKRIAFIRTGRLWTMNADGTDPKLIIDTPSITSYDWAPDGKWIAFTRQDPYFASEVYLIASTGGEATNLTRYATSNSGVSWSSSNNRLSFLSNRRGATSAFTITLSSAANNVGFDLDDIHLRATRVSTQPAESVIISPDGGQVAFRSGTGKEDDLWIASSTGANVSRLTSGGQTPRSLYWAKKASGLVYFLNSTGELRAARTALAGITGSSGPSGEPLKIAFNAKMVIRDSEEFQEMFDQAWRLLGDQFYDSTYHGADWNAVRVKYRPMVSDIGKKEDLYALISLMLGELNASHLGISGPSRSTDEQTAYLGLLFDRTHQGNGLKIAGVIKRGPADKRGMNLKAGDVIAAIDRTELTPQVNISQLLNAKVGESIKLDILDPAAPKGRRRVDVVGASRQALAPLMYQRWVSHNAELTNKLSQGRIGYIHIPSMDEDGLEQFVRALYSDHFDKDAILLDVRFNGGGFTHDQVLAYLTGRPHTTFRRREGGEGSVMRNYDRKWSKPLALLINNRSYSDAEIFPNAFRTLNLGKLIGTPTGGHVIGTVQGKLIDGSTFRLPRTGVFTLKGVNMDKEGVTPDILVEASADEFAVGRDSQLQKGVETLLQQLAAPASPPAQSANP